MTQKIWDMLTQSAGLGYRSMLLALLASLVAGVYIFFIYRLLTKPTFYVRSFGVTLAGVSVIVTAIIVAMQSSLVVSLGMVGALSIVRFRTAIKDPMDLMFLFWSVSCGIIAGTLLYMLLAVVCLVVTVLVLVLQRSPLRKAPVVLVVHADTADAETAVEECLRAASRSWRVRSRSISAKGLDLIVELRTDKEKELIAAVGAKEGIRSASLVSYDGDVRA